MPIVRPAAKPIQNRCGQVEGVRREREDLRGVEVGEGGDDHRQQGGDHDHPQHLGDPADGIDAPPEQGMITTIMARPTRSLSAVFIAGQR